MLDGHPSGARWAGRVLLTAAVLAAPGPAAALEVAYGDVEIATEVEPRERQVTHGYVEYRFAVRNRGDDPVRVTLQIPADRLTGSGSGGLVSVTRTVEVAPGGIASVSLLQPSAPDVAGSNLAVYINGRKQEQRISLSLVSGTAPPAVAHSRRGRRTTSYSTSPGIATSNLLASHRVPEAFFKVRITAPDFGVASGRMPGAAGAGMGGAAPEPGGALEEPLFNPAAGGAARPVGPGKVATIEAPPFAMQLTRSELPVSAWSGDWLACTRYDGILIWSEDLEELQRGAETRATLQALWQYTEAGGVLVVLGSPKHKFRVPIPAAYGRPYLREPGRLFYPVGFGLCIVVDDRTSATWKDPGHWESLRAAFSQTAQRWQQAPPLLELNRTFPVVDELGVPVKGLFALLVLFGITMGPVNLVLLTRYQRRIWLLWTVPALALFFCLAVLGYMVVAEGWQGHSRLLGVTLLDETEKRATTLGRAAFYSPVTPSDGLRFSTQTEVQILGPQHAAWGNACTLDWADDQHLARGWITARVPAYFELRKSEPLRRERLTLRREADGSLIVVNALGADVEELLLADERGRLYRATGIPAGSSARLERDGRKAAPDAARRRRQDFYISTNWVQAAETMRARPEQYLEPGMYLAVVSSSPFLEPGLKSAHPRPADSIVLGISADLVGKR